MTSLRMIDLCSNKWRWMRLVSFFFFILYFIFSSQRAFAQFNTNRLLTIGRSALYYEDYVLSIQYFNQVINARPYLYEPWFYRGIAKYYLDDYVGAENDCTEAIHRNPYVTGIYELRGLCRIQQKNYAAAIEDYNAALRYDPEGQTLWHNRALCRIQQKDYDGALADLDTMAVRWSKNARVFAMQAEAYLLKTDTTQAISSLDKSLQLDAYDGNTWAQRAVISLARSQWKEGKNTSTRPSTCCPRMPASISTVPWRVSTRATCAELWQTMIPPSTSNPTTS